jgi:hypothetical protein
MPRTLIGLGILVLLFTYVGMVFYQSLASADTDEQIAAGQYRNLIGKSKSDIVREYGMPNLVEDGSSVLPSSLYLDDRRNCILLTYARPEGTLYVGFVLRGNDWICTYSQLLPNGACF